MYGDHMHYQQDSDGSEALSDDNSADVEFVPSDSVPSEDESMQGDAADVDLEAPQLFTPPRDDAILTLRGHRESVFCLAVDPLGTYIASGAQDHTAIVWDLKTGTIAFTAEGHEDSVTCVAFTSDGQMLATGDMSGDVRVWRRPSTPSPVWSLLLHEHVSDLLWFIWWSPPSSHRSKASVAVLAAGDNDGLVTLWSVCPSSTASDAKRAKYIGGVGVAALSGIFYLPSVDTDRPRLVVLYQNSEIRLWDVKSEQSLTSLTLKTDKDETKESEVFCLACPHETTARDQELLAVGGFGAIYMVVVKYSLSMEPEFTSKCVAVLDTSDGSSVEALDFSWTHPYFAFGTADGTLGIVDNTKMHFRQKWTYSDEISDQVGFTSLRWSHQEPIFFTSTTHCAVIGWSGGGGGGHCDTHSVVDAGSSTTVPAPLFIWWGHQAMILDLVLIPSSNVVPTAPTTSGPAHRSVETRLVASASDDSTVKLFSMDCNTG